MVILPSSISLLPSAFFPHPSAFFPQPSAFFYQPSALFLLPSAFFHQLSSLIHQPSSLSLQPSSLKSTSFCSRFSWKFQIYFLLLQRERRSQVEPRCAERWHGCGNTEMMSNSTLPLGFLHSKIPPAYHLVRRRHFNLRDYNLPDCTSCLQRSQPLSMAK